MIIKHFLGAMAGVWATTVLFHTPKKYLPACSISGAIAWICNYFLIERGISSMYAIILSSVLLTVMSRYLAVWMKTPATVFLMPGIFPLVPGDDIYYTAQYLSIHSFDLASSKEFETLISAGAIAFGIMIGFLLPQFLFSRRRR